MSLTVLLSISTIPTKLGTSDCLLIQAVPNKLDAPSPNHPRLPDPVPAVPGILKVAPKPVVANILQIHPALDSVTENLSGLGSFPNGPNGLVNLPNDPRGLVSFSNNPKGLVSFPNGAVVPQNEPEVAAARARILALLAKEGILLAEEGQTSKNHYRPGHGLSNPVYGANYRHPALHNQGTEPEVEEPRYNSNLNLNLVSHPNGALVPVDEPAVVAARKKHLAAPGHTGLVKDGPVRHRYDLVNNQPDLVNKSPGLVTQVPGLVTQVPGLVTQVPGLVTHPNGAIVPVESPDVRAARAAHLAFHQKH